MDDTDVLEVHVIPSSEVITVPSVPTATKDGVSVVNPFEVSYWLLREFPALSLIPVLTLVLYVVAWDKLSEGSIVNVLSELELEGDDDI